MKRRKKTLKPAVKFPLRELLARYGWSQRKLAAASGIDEQRVSALCQGKNSPTWRTILRIVTTLGADLGDLQPGKKEDVA